MFNYNKYVIFILVCILYTIASCKKSTIEISRNYLEENITNRVGYSANQQIQEIITSIDELPDSIKQIRKKYIPSVKKIVNAIIKNSTDRKLVLDSEFISQEYIEQHLQCSLELWEKPWASHLNYKEFCRFLLPYRISNEPLEDWRKLFLSKFPWLINLQQSQISAIDAVNIINDSCKNYVGFCDEFDKVQPLTIKEMISIGLSNCQDRTRFAALMMRSIGLPVGVVSNKRGHAWNVLLNKDKKWLSFQGCESNIVNDISLMRACQTTKVYMNTFEANAAEVTLLNKYKDKCPKKYLTIFCEDITEHILNCSNITVDINKKATKHPVFLLTGRNKRQKWIPVDVSLPVNKSKISFNHVGTENLYLCASFNQGEMTALSPPFFINKDKTIKFFEPDFTNEDSIVFYRKTEVMNSMYAYSKKLLGCTIYGSNRRDFKDSVLLHVIDKCYDHMRDEAITYSEEKFRYFIFKGTNKPMNISELILKDEHNREIKGHIFHSEVFWRKAENAFDKKYETYLSAGKNQWFCMDAGHKERLSSIQMVSRNNQNLIENGENYALFYWDGKWKKIEEKIASNNRVIFTHVPSHSILYLACTSKGVESTMCWVKNNEPRWAVTRNYYRDYKSTLN